jgi:hypothetical protein
MTKRLLRFGMQTQLCHPVATLRESNPLDRYGLGLLLLLTKGFGPSRRRFFIIFGLASAPIASPGRAAVGSGVAESLLNPLPLGAESE